jgi:predicted nucleic acid-binding protein
MLVPGSTQAVKIDQWLVSGQSLATSAVAWSEFLNGPVTPVEISGVEAVLESRIIAFGRAEALLAANLFNQTGRRRGSRFDCLIAATAISCQAELATADVSDFKPFAPLGLQLV